jgi:small nuclear ribonucleoprotein G
MNLVVDEAVEDTRKGEKIPIGMVVIRGNAVVLLESMDRI